MNREDIIRMAKECGAYPAANVDGALLFWSESQVERFAALVASVEREACAQFIEHEYVRQFERPWRVDLSAAIRARGNVATNDTSQERVDKTSEIVHESVAWEQFYPEMGKPKLAYLSPTESPDNACYIQPQRKPLTDEEFRAILRSLSRQQGWDGDGWDLALKEAIEAAHGIKGEA